MGPTPSGASTGLFVISIFGGPPRQLREQAGRASVAPDGAHIAFISGKNNSEIWVMDASGQDPHPFVTVAETDQVVQVQWSPDSQRVAYMLLHNGGATPQLQIVSRALNGASAEVILSNPGLRSFCWAPDDRVIYSADEPGSNSDETNLWWLHVGKGTGKPDGSPHRITQWAGFAFSDLSITADGKQLAFTRAGQQSNVYAADLAPARNPAEARPITFDERHDIPSAWTPDGRAVYFESDRNGHWGIFLQPLDGRVADEFMIGSDEPQGVSAVWGGSALLFWSHLAGSSDTSMHLMRVPAQGGAPQFVLQARPGSRVRCALQAQRCLLSEPQPEHRQTVFFDVDPEHGIRAELFRLELDPYVVASWDLSPDGATVAWINFSGSRDNEVRLRRLLDGNMRSVTVAGNIVNLNYIAWTSDAKLLVVATVPRGSSLLLVDLAGRARVIASSTNSIAAPVPSPDGKHVAFALNTQTSNAWLISNF